ncbi:MAG: hypothetical protein OSJ74_03060 [Clostridia bacterium]|nr:hypothetical protein [Clostridia bacterium]
MTEQRPSFEERLKSMDEKTVGYYNKLKDCFLQYKGVKNRLSLRCDSYRLDGRLLAKLAIGGASLKIYLAIDISDEEILQKKLRFRDVSQSAAYNEVPAMIPIKSDLCARKVCEIIDVMMSRNGCEKN